MPAPSPDYLAASASTTSSGYSDGLGRRMLAFDREEGTMLERLVLRPELAAFERMLRERVEAVAALEDERLARPRTVERETDGSVVVVSEFVPGSRLAELLEVASEHGAAPGIDAAVGFLLDVLPALCGLHAGAGFPHATISPSRIVMTPAGQVVLLDCVYGGALAHLRYSRRRLWTDFGIATPSTGAPRLNVEADLAQIALAGMLLVVGRPLRANEYPEKLPPLLREVGEVAQIRMSGPFSELWLDFLRRALVVPGTRPYGAADDALIELRELASALGLAECRRALVDFIEQMESSRAPAEEEARDWSKTVSYEDFEFQVAGDQELHDQEPQFVFDEDTTGVDSDDEDDEAEIDLDTLVAQPPESPAGWLEPVHDPSEDLTSRSRAGHVPGTDRLDAFLADSPSAAGPAPALPGVEVPAAHALPPPVAAPIAAPTPAAGAAAPADVGEWRERFGTEPTPAAPILDAVEAAMPPPAAVEDHLHASEEESRSAPSVRSRRAKRTRSARARKDKLRSAATRSGLKTPPPQEPERVEWQPAEPEEKQQEKEIRRPEEKKKRSSWLVPPDRAAAFEPPLPDNAPLPAPAPVVLPTFAAPPLPPPVVVAPPLHAQAPPPAAVPVRPEFAVYPPVPLVTSGVATPPSLPAAWQPPPPPKPSPAAAKPSHAAQPVPLKLKEPSRPRRVTPAPQEPHSAPVLAAGRNGPAREFPWKAALSAAAVILVLMGIVGARKYLPGSTPASAPAEAPTVPEETGTTPTPAAASRDGGRLEVETQPAGARILLDGEPAGESPLTLEGLSPGRHTVTIVSASGSVKRTVRIEAGRTAKLDVPIFSGWVGIYVPFVVEVVENGRVIGTTEDPRIMLSPGRHVLTLRNRELGYTSVHTVDIEPGKEQPLNLDPRGSLNLNASPWAEVWIDGRKAGDTPLANQQIPLGIREIVFRHPQYGERRVTLTVKADAPAAVSIDMTKP